MLSHWGVEVIENAYRTQGLHIPRGSKNHSSGSVATSWAVLEGFYAALPGFTELM